MRNVKKLFLLLGLLPLTAIANSDPTISCLTSGNYAGYYEPTHLPIHATIQINANAIHLHIDGKPYMNDYDLDGFLNFNNPNQFSLGGAGGIDLNGFCINHKISMFGDLDKKNIVIHLHKAK